MDSILSLSYSLDYFIHRTHLELHVLFSMISRREFCCTYISRRIFYLYDDVYMLYKGVFVHVKINWVKSTHGHYLVLFLPLLLFINGCCLLIYTFLFLRDFKLRTNCFQKEGNDSIPSLKLIGSMKNQEVIYCGRISKDGPNIKPKRNIGV